MNRSDWLLVALNAFLLVWAVAGLASIDEDPLIITAMLAMLTAVVNGAYVLRGRRQRAPSRTRAREDEMDPRTVLELDARLEALERREREMQEAERIQHLVARGQQSAPEAPLASPSRQRLGASGPDPADSAPYHLRRTSFGPLTNSTLVLSDRVPSVTTTSTSRLSGRPSPSGC